MDSAPGNHLHAVQTELKCLETYRRRSYLGVLILTIGIVLLSWIFRENGDPFIALAYPVFAVILAGLSVLLWRQSTALRTMEIILVATAGTMILSRLLWHFTFSDPLGDHLLLLAGGHYWAVGLLIVGAFITLGYRGGMIDRFKVGIAEYIPGKGTDDAINRADAMLYRAKDAGRNRVITEACEMA